MGLGSAHLSQVSIRKAVQVLLETTDMNCVLIPVGTEIRMVRLASSTAAAWAAPEGTTVVEGTRQGSCCCYTQGSQASCLIPRAVSPQPLGSLLDSGMIPPFTGFLLCRENAATVYEILGMPNCYHCSLSQRREIRCGLKLLMMASRG